jgi:Bacterial membrane protein YfhO
MRDGMRAGLAARVLLTFGALLPYWRLLTFGVIFITDDYFASDIFNGELPGRVLMGQLIRSGQLPVWTSHLCSGIPLIGLPADPIGVAAFALLPPAPALDLFVIVLLLVAAHGAYGLARRFDADRTAAVLAGLAFAGSGYVACQLKHLSIVSTVVWLPVGILLLDRALGGDVPRTMARRALLIASFGLVFAQQVLCGFPQSSYICALVYGSFVLFRMPAVWRLPVSPRVRVGLLGGVLLATILGAAAGSIVLLPLSALGSISDRAEALGWDWSTRLAYWPKNAIMFLFPYANGDISNASYEGPPFFWEDYGYVGFFTFLLAVYGAVRERKRPEVGYTIALTLVAYFFVLGAATPVFRVAYLLIPGMKTFRFPTRFLIVVELGLAILAAVGLTRIRRDLEPSGDASGFRRKAPVLVPVALCALTALDLFVHQPRQNPMVPAREWLAPPPSVSVVHAGGEPRTFTPRHRDLHRLAFLHAEGWKDVRPYFDLRDLLQPNLGGGFWSTPSADCYAGISAQWYVNVWGDHNREASMISLLAAPDFDAGAFKVHPLFSTVLKTYGVTHVLSAYPQQGSALPFVSRAGNAYIYRVDGAERVRFVRSASIVKSNNDAVSHLLGGSFDPDREVLLHDAPDSAALPLVDGDAAARTSSSRPVIAHEDAREMVVTAEAPQDGYLLVADTFYPGWTARVDGTPTPVYRADLSVRAVPLPRGRHEIRFSYDPPGFRRGAWITLLSVSTLLLWIGGAAYADRRSRR